ncbi:hypothetical protein C0991_005623 [Blastosporella zonata]|nr:hypothetical protein C0991_005623 [Blastosporella zonata]
MTLAQDPYQLDRLADELATRELADAQDFHDLPNFVPLSHDNPFLTVPDFKVEQFLLSRSNTSLPDLRSELREYLSQLKEELVKLINDDYEAFISLSTDLKDEGDRLVQLKSPLGDLKLQILRSRSELQVIQDAIQEKLQKRTVLREEKALLHLLLKLSESVTRLESLLLITSPENDPSRSLDVKPTLSSNLDHTDESTDYRIDRIQSTISSDLDHVFATALVALTDGNGEGKVTEVEKSKLLADVTECLKTYDILGLWRDAEDVLRREVVRKFVRKASSDDPLAKLYSQTLRFVERDLSRIMNIAEMVSMKSLSSSRIEKDLGFTEPPREHIDDEFQIMANVIWEEFGRALMDELGGIIFASGRPNQFRTHHELSQAFVRSLEYLAPSAHSIKVMRLHPVYTAFEQRWQLPVYFQMRWKEVVGSLEESFAVTRIEPVFVKDKTSFVTSQANAVWVAITACWSAEVFIPDLCPRFWRLTLQNPSSPSHTRASTPVQTHDPTSAETMAADDTILRQNVAIIADIKTLRTHLMALWREEISMMLPEVSADDETSGANAQDALQNIMSSLTSLIAPLSTEVVIILTKRCCDALLPVRSIPSQFRAMSNKRTPTEPSYFVASTLRPLKLFFGIGVGDGIGLPLGEDYVQPFSIEIFDNVVQRYVYYLTAMKKTEESLRRLKKGKKPTFSLFGTAGTGKDDDGRDEERIRVQMILDVEAFGKDAESLGVILQSSEAYNALREMVQAPEAPDLS